ncbi:LRR domain containing protein [Parasponia andersonii]|uniref:LRR domain containing protein n=1 Tax=Parasponia andersonii TaxID=3476 RepID=A0A2P5DAB4_PARAD|nr:LRR domain containing protein [Parasponia andersonii]
MAEGFVSSENVAYECLLELMQRSMVQRGVLGSIDERVKTCRIHDLMRDLCLSKAQEENFLQIIDISENRQETMDSLSSCKVRRLSLIHLTTDNVSDHKLLSIIKDGCLRSFTCFDSCFGPKILKPWFDFFYRQRVLKLEGKYLYVVNLPKEIGKLIHLRFLSFKEIRMVSLPSSIRNLTCLQTLDLQSCNKISIVTKSIKREKILGCEELLKNVVTWRLEYLRHLYLPSYFQLSRGNQLLLEHASNLQILVNISVSYPGLDKILQRTTLTKLKVYFNKIWDGGIQCNHLHSLTVNLALHGNYVNRDIVTIISSCPELYELKVTGAREILPNDNQFSLNLIKLSLKDTNLESDPTPTLEKLPNLRVLFLKNALEVDEIVCSRGGFPRLESLSVYGLWIKEWRVDEGSLHCLSHLSLQAC